MTDMTSEQVKRLDMRAIGKIFRETARKQRTHESITNEDALDLVNIVAIHGDRLADAIGLFFHAEPARPHSPAPRVDDATMREMLCAELRKVGFGPGWCEYIVSEEWAGRPDNKDDDSDRRFAEAALAFGRALMERK